MDYNWLKHALKANKEAIPDAIAMQYIAGAAKIVECGLQIAGEATYGPLLDGNVKKGQISTIISVSSGCIRNKWTSRRNDNGIASIAQGSSVWFGATGPTCQDTFIPTQFRSV